MTFSYLKTVYLADTDAAGVVYFARAMEMCHEAYEEWLVSIGIALKQLLLENKIALPIIHGEINFFRPMFCGDKLKITLQPTQIDDTEFAISYQIFQLSAPKKAIVQATTNHVCINPTTRTRIPLPSAIIKSI